MRISLALLLFTFRSYCFCQINHFPFVEHFDSVIVPALPPGWLTTANRSASGDFSTTRSVPRSDSNAVVSTNSTLGQALASPLLNLSDREADSLVFYERRSSSHNSGLILEASTDGGGSFPHQIGDTLMNPGTTSYVRRAFALPGALGNQPAVRIRWRILGNGSGTTGTIRFDDVTVTAKPALDAELRSISFSPAVPRSGDSVTITASVRNSGTSPLSRFTVEFYVDGNGDSVAEPQERVGSESENAPLPPNETHSIESHLSGFTAGIKTIIAVVAAPGDQNSSNDTLRGKLTVAYAPSSLVINEIMYDPVGGGSEYVELFNPTPQAVDLSGWSITDEGAARTSGHVISHAPLVIGPRDYAVIAGDSSIFRRFEYLAESMYHVAVRPSAFSLNNAGDVVIVSDPTRSTVDSVRYSPDWHNQEIDDPSGRSIERISPVLGSNDRRNWSTSADALGGTPGKLNSLYLTSRPSESGMSFSPNPFSPDGDPFGAFLPNHPQGSKTLGFAVSKNVADNGRSHQETAAGHEIDCSGRGRKAGCPSGQRL